MQSKTPSVDDYPPAADRKDQAMPVFELEESNYAGPIPEDEILMAEITGVKQVKKPFKDENDNDIIKIEFAFVVQDPESTWYEQRIWGETSPTFNTHPDCKLRAWAQEILGQELPPKFRLDTDDLVGHACRIVVAAKEYDKNGEKRTRNYVKDVIRSKNGTAFAGDEEPF